MSASAVGQLWKWNHNCHEYFTFFSNKHVCVYLCIKIYLITYFFIYSILYWFYVRIWNYWFYTIAFKLLRIEHFISSQDEGLVCLKLNLKRLLFHVIQNYDLVIVIVFDFKHCVSRGRWALGWQEVNLWWLFLWTNLTKIYDIKLIKLFFFYMLGAETDFHLIGCRTVYHQS